MPMRKGAPVGESIRELKSGKTYRRTKKKYGTRRARRQSLAIALKNARTPTRKPKRHRKHSARR